MPAVVTSLLLALGQLADPRILRILLKTLAVTLVLFAVVAVAGWYALDQTLAWAGLGDTLFAGAEGVRGLATGGAPGREDCGMAVQAAISGTSSSGERRIPRGGPYGG